MVHTRGGNAFFLLCCSISGKYKDCATSGSFTCHHVHTAVADDIRCFQVNSKLACSLLEHPRLWFATVACFSILRFPVVRMVRTIINAIETSIVSSEQLFQPLVHSRKVVLSQEPSCDAGLVGDHKDFDAESVRLAYRLGSVRNQLEIFRAGKIINLGVDGAVSVEEDTDLCKLYAFNVAAAPYTN